MGEYADRDESKAAARRPDRVAGARPKTPGAPTVESYLDLQVNRIRPFVAAHFGQTSWPDPAPDVPFAPGKDRWFGTVLGQRLWTALGDVELAKRLVFPDDLAVPLAQYVIAAGVDRMAWMPAFGMAVARLLERSATASLRERIGPRMRLALATRAVLPEAEDLLASHPIDPYVAGVLVIPGVVDVTQVVASGGAAPAKARTVEVTWMGRAHRELWNFVEARPSSATAEEVALALWGSTTMAYALTAHGRVFEVRPAEARAVIAQRFPAEIVGEETSHAAQVAALAGTEQGAREARAQRTGVPGAMLTEEQLREVEAKIGVLLGQIRAAVQPVGMDALLIPAFAARSRRVAALAEADAVARAQWSATLMFQHAQLLTLAKAIPPLVSELRTMQMPEEALSPARRERRDEVRADLEAYVQAAAVSYIGEESNELVQRVEAKHRRAALDAMDGSEIELAESTRALTDRNTPSRRGLATVEAELAALRSAELHAQKTSPYDHQRILISAGELALSQRIEASDDALAALGASADALDMGDRARVGNIRVPGIDSVPDMIAGVRARLANVHRIWDQAEQDAFGATTDPHAPEGWAEWEARKTALTAARRAFAAISGDQSLGAFFAAMQKEIRDEQFRAAFLHAGQMLLIAAATMGVGIAVDFAVAELVAEGASLGSRAAGLAFTVGFNATISAGIQYAMSNGTESFGRALLVNALADLGARGVLGVLRRLIKPIVDDARAIAALPHLTEAEATAAFEMDFAGTEAMVELAGSLGAQWAADKLVSLARIGTSPGAGQVSDSLASTVLEQGVAIAIGRFFAGRIHAWQQHRERLRQLGFDRAVLEALVAARDRFFADAAGLAANPSPEPSEGVALVHRDGELVKQERALLSTPLTDEQRALIAKATSDAPPRGEKEHNSFQPHELQDVRRWMNHGIDEAANTAKHHPDQASAKDKAALAFREDPEVQRWFERWLELPDRLLVNPDGSVEIRLPKDTPARVADILRTVIPETNGILMTRAMAMEERIARELPGVSLDPMAPDWLATRKRLVEMFGEERVRSYEASRGGVVDPKVASRVDEVIEPASLTRLRAALPDVEMYVTGSASQPEKQGGTSDVDLVVVVPEGTPLAARAEIEQRLNSMHLETADATHRPLPIDAKVMTPRELAGASMLETPSGRTPLRYARVDGNAGPKLGVGDTGVDLHTHVMGVPATRYFVARVGGGNAARTLELAWDAVHDGKFPVSSEVLRQLGVAIADVRNARQVAMPEAVIEARATRALDAVLAASAETPFDHTYDLRDALVQAYIDPHGTYENFATDVLEDLSQQGVTYSEQSVSGGKLDKRFTPEAMAKAHARAGANDADLRFLVMVPTDRSLSSRDPSSAREALRRQLMRADVRGIDVAGPESGRFTEEGLRWFREVVELAREVAREKGEDVVVRPHVGEGYDPHATGEHVDIARYNLDKMIGALEQLGYRTGQGVVVRFGHATHSTSAQRQRMAALGVIVESNVGSNLATGSILHAEEHPILAQMFDGVSTVLATDAQGVMSTNLPLEYQRVVSLIERFRGGEALEIDGKQYHWKDLTEAQQARFSVGWLKQQLASYMEGVKR